MIIPTGATDPRMTTAKRQTLADFMYYSLCAGQTKAGPYGYSPLPLNLVQAGFAQIAKLKTADPAVDLTDRDVTHVQQPDLRRPRTSKNELAEIAPQPAACDKVGEGPCGTETGTQAPRPATDDGAAPAGVGQRPAAAGRWRGGPRTAPVGDGAAVAGDRPRTRRLVAPAGTTPRAAADAAATELAPAAGGHRDVRMGGRRAAARAGAAARPAGLVASVGATRPGPR